MRFTLLLLIGCTTTATYPDWWCTHCRATVRGRACVSCRAEYRTEYGRPRWTCAACRVECLARWCWKCGAECAVCPEICLQAGAHVAWWCGACRATVHGHACLTCRAEFRVDSRRDRWICAKCGVDCFVDSCWSCGDDVARDDGRYATWTCKKCGKKNTTYRCPVCDK